MVGFSNLRSGTSTLALIVNSASILKIREDLLSALLLWVGGLIIEWVSKQ